MKKYVSFLSVFLLSFVLSFSPLFNISVPKPVNAMAGFNISPTGNNNITITPVYLTGTSYNNSNTQAAVDAMVNYWNAQAAGTTFHLTANVTSPMTVNALIPQQNGSCTTSETAANTMFFFVGNSLGGVTCNQSTPYLVTTATAPTLAHEFGHILGLGHGYGIMASSGAFFTPLDASQKQTLGWSAGSSFPPGCTSNSGFSITTGLPCSGGSNGGGGSPANGSIGNSIDIGGYGQVALVCPSTPIVANAGSVANIELTKSGYSLAVISAQIPSRLGPMGGHDVGVRGRPTSGFAQSFPSVVSLGQFDNFASLPVEVSSSVNPGTYNIDVEGSVSFVVPDYTGDGEPDGVMGYTTCKTTVQVMPAGSQQNPSSFGRINGILGGVPVHEMNLQPGDTAPIQFSSAGASACYLKVNGQPRTTLNNMTAGSFTSDPARSGASDLYQIYCQVSGAGSGTYTPITADATLTINSGIVNTGGMTAQLQVSTLQHIHEETLGGCLQEKQNTPEAAAVIAPETLNPGHEQTINGNVYCVHDNLKFVPSEISAITDVGSPVKVIWTSTGATECQLSPLGWNGTSGQSNFMVSAPMHLRLVCTNDSGQSTTKSFTINLSGNLPGNSNLPPALVCTPGDYLYIPPVGGLVSVKTELLNVSGPITLEPSLVGVFEGGGQVIPGGYHVQSPLSGLNSGVNTLSILFDSNIRALAPNGFFKIAAKNATGSVISSCQLGLQYTYTAGTNGSAGTGGNQQNASFSIGEQVVVTTADTKSAVNVRNTAGGVKVGAQSFGSSGTVLSLPTSTPDGHTAYKVGFSKGVSTGFVDSRYLQKVNAGAGASKSPVSTPPVGNGGVLVTGSGCTAAGPYNTITGKPCSSTNLPPAVVIGCTASFVYSPVTGETCIKNSEVSSSGLVNNPAVSAPIIASLSPASGPVGTIVTLRGYYITPNHIVNFGSGKIPISGDALTFQVPPVLSYPCATSTACTTPPTEPVIPAVYGVSVTGTNGTSNLFNFKVE